jgi:hypothetical protein
MAKVLVQSPLSSRPEMSGFYQPPLDGLADDPFMRDGDDRLIRRSYWLDLSDRSLIQIMTDGIGTRLTADEKRAHLTDIRRPHLIDRLLAPEILPPER